MPFCLLDLGILTFSIILAASYGDSPKRFRFLNAE